MKIIKIAYVLPIGLAVVLTACHHEEKKVVKTTSDTISVQTAPVQLLQPQKDIVLPGELMPYYSAQIYPKAKGFIIKMNVDRGTHVTAGQVLAVLDAPELKADAGEAQAKLENNKAQLMSSRLTYQRLLQASKTKGAIALNELSIAQSRKQADSAEVDASRAVLVNKTKLLDYLTIRAPFDGTITDRNVSIGDLVGPDEASKTHPLFVLEETGKLRLTVAIPEIYSSSMDNKSQISFGVSSLPGEMFKASLSRTSESIETQTRSMMSEFDVDNAMRKLKAGTFVDVTLPIQRTGKTLFVPTSSVINSTEKQYVICPQNGKAHLVLVKKGIALDSLVEVFGSLKPDDKVVINASEDIKEGIPLAAHQ